jgi:hypothetical protein
LIEKRANDGVLVNKKVLVKELFVDEASGDEM